MLGERIYLATGVWCSPTRVPSLEETTYMENGCVEMLTSKTFWMPSVVYSELSITSTQTQSSYLSQPAVVYFFELVYFLAYKTGFS